MIKSLQSKLKDIDKGIEKVVDDIYEEYALCINYADIAIFFTVGTLLGWEKMLYAAFNLFIQCDANIFIEEKGLIMQEDDEFKLFLEMALQYQSKLTDPHIRGPDGLAIDFYKFNGGAEQLSPFLFGLPSQSRG
ncbi:MAG: hypothetical protein OMM_12147 [Candidatus Magnetoglobus multicellularis str. Araruama]|uniref:Uncharacterized protein n=1 Tax=Candidatus Magnetoglobus multicellularis str. Araruama TaxID=890399 RepID=A0A1V1NWH2_9BACT|nr:MAG: hypothetical protein OMM_12147 [Candidatus Magnetoglobus multicellularis str. Araruama]